MAYITFLAFIVMTGTVAYAQVPGIQYALAIAFLLTMLVTRTRYEAYIVRSIGYSKIVGGLVVCTLLLSAIGLSGGSFRLALEPLIVLGSFLLTYGIIGSVLASSKKSYFELKKIQLVLLLMLFLILFGQYLQLKGVLSVYVSDDFGITLSEGQSFLDIGLRRYGGFTNANLTNSIVLTLLYTIYVISSRSREMVFSSISTIVAVAIVLFTQSRSGIIFLVPLVVWYVISQLRSDRISASYVLVFAFSCVFVIAVALGFGTDYSIDPFGGLIARFSRPLEAEARVLILHEALEVMGRRPFWGSGYRYLENTTGAGAHNMLVTSVVNYGAVGTIILAIGSILLYRSQSLSLYVFCIMKPVLFSQNFYDQVGYQIVLGLACAVNMFLVQRQHREGDPAAFAGSFGRKEQRAGHNRVS